MMSSNARAKLLVQFHDEEDGCTYTLNMSPEDMLAIANMPAFPKRTVTLPSINGTANLLDGVVVIMHETRPGNFESICVRIEHAKTKIAEALQTDQDQ